MARNGKGKKPTAGKLYQRFAMLADASDEEIMAFTEENGPLGLGSRQGEWYFRGILPLSTDGMLRHYFVPFEHGELIPLDSFPWAQETTETIRWEAKKMNTIIELHRLLWECYDYDDKNEIKLDMEDPWQKQLGMAESVPLFRPDRAESRMDRINALGQIIAEAWPDQAESIMFKSEQRGEFFALPDLRVIYYNLLLRVQFITPITPLFWPGGKSWVGGLPRKIDFHHTCLLAKLWKDALFEIIEGTVPPLRCSHCHVLFTPTRPEQTYHSSECQKAAVQQRRRRRLAMDEGRKLRPTPGRPPKEKSASNSPGPADRSS